MIDKLHIVVLGACNSGKSSLVNLLTRQHTSLVADHRGTTTDPVRKVMELPHLGASVIIDTPGFDDETPLGAQRIEITKRVLNEASVVLFLVGENEEAENKWAKIIAEKRIPMLKIATKSDLRSIDNSDALAISSVEDFELNRQRLIDGILSVMPKEFGEPDLLRGFVKMGDLVMLVMPQDGSAPAGRLILPQQQTLRRLLDVGAVVISVQPSELEQALDMQRKSPKLIITDSQVFGQVAPLVPSGTRLTSFSILMAAYKGDIDYFAASVKVIDTLSPNCRILIAEACTHSPQSEDIGTVKIPAMLRKKLGNDITIDHVAGRDFPTDLKRYDLVIHCGGCMFNRPYILSRVEQAKRQGVPMTNYGVTIAYVKGIPLETVI